MVAVEWETQSRVRFQSNNVVEFHDGRTADCEFKDEEPHLLEVKSEDIVVVSVGGDVARSCNVTVSGHEVFGLSSIDMLDRKHLRALDHETAAVSGLRLAGYGRPLPHWFAR